MSRAKDLDQIAPDNQVIFESKNDKEIEEQKHDSNQVNEILNTKKHSRSFIVHPKNFSFIEQDDTEEILLVLRPHWFTNVSWVLTLIFFVFLPILISFIPLPEFIPSNYKFISILFWYLFVFIFGFEKFLAWYFNLFVITNQRVVDIDFNNILDKKFSEASLDMIQDVTSRVAGVGQTFFNYGNVLIQTASEINEVVFEKVPNPEKIIRLLQELREGRKK